MKLKIVHKGLILLAIPLVLGIAFVLLLYCGLAESNRLVERELKLKDAMITHITSARSAAAQQMCAMAFLGSRDSYFAQEYQSNRRRSLSSFQRLKELLKNEKLSIPPLDLSRQQVIQGRVHGATTETTFLFKLQRMIDRQTKAALSSMRALQMVLYGGILLGVCISIGLAVFFCLTITNRLLIIVNNTMNLSNNLPLTPPLKGSDEIAELDQLLYKSGTEIRELERFKKEMVGVVSHELKSPLSSVGGFLSSLGAGVYGEISDKAKDRIDRTYNNVKRLMGLVAELLYLDRLELDMKAETIEIKDLLAIAIDNVKELSEQYGIEIVVRSEGGRLFADRDRLVQVIVNLLSNALKFSPEKGTVVLEAKKDGNNFLFRIIDEGRGIPEEFRKQIFEPFGQVAATDAVTKKGTGLGLTISRSIVEQHGGTIGVDSEVGKGSTFWFKIPLEGGSGALRLNGDSKTNKASTLAMLPGKSASEQLARGARKFSVFQQGLLLFSVPLIFQLVFGSVIGYMVYQVQEQTRLEKRSKEILDSLNRGAEILTNSCILGMTYVFTKNPEAQEPWQKGRDKVLECLEKAARLCASNPKEAKAIEDTRDSVNKISAVIDSEAQKGSNNKSAKKILEMSGMGDLAEMVQSMPLAEFMSLMTAAPVSSGVMPSGAAMTESDSSAAAGENPMNSGSMPEMMMRLRKIGATSKMMAMQKMFYNSAAADAESGSVSPGTFKTIAPPGESTYSGQLNMMHRFMGAFMRMGGMGNGAFGALGMFNEMQSLFADSVNVKVSRPFLELQAAQDQIMDQEIATSQRLALQRSKMIRNLQLTLLGGIVLNVVLSVLLALLLMRNLTNRLQHVMDNTNRLRVRQRLEPPLKGSDEIAHLDRVLYHTGKRLVELENFKRELISVVSHELRTPLLSISSALELLQAGILGQLSEKGLNRLKFAQEEAVRLIRLVNDLLDIEKMEAGKFVLDKSETRVSDLLEQVIAASSALAEVKEIKLESSAPPGDPSLLLDRDRLCQVLINLLSNAIKFSPEKETINITVEKTMNGKNKAEFKFSVIDHGRGIPDEARAKIFDRFVQVEKTDQTERGGSGLGLAISKAIVQQHGGSIGVDSEPGKGSTFWFTLPA